ncbi:MAG: transcriptional regulator [Methanobacteriales archaeon]|nr:transcriptional regulator [Methanobacteriales archaeon]
MPFANLPVQREELISDITKTLTNHGFETSNIYDRSCFDLVARRELILLLMKVLVNVDGFSQEQAREIKMVANTLLASPLVVGVKSKNEYLEEDVVYERHGIPVIGMETFRNLIVDNLYPEVFAARGGYYVQIDGEIIKELREEQDLSLKELADLAHVSRETIYKYETGRARAHPETAMVLERILNMKITVSVNLFQVPITAEDAKIRESEHPELEDLGYGVIKTNRTPFDALAKPDQTKSKDAQPIIANLDKQRNQKLLAKMAVNLRDISSITDTEAAFILATRRKLNSIEGVPVVHNWEMEELKNSRDFMKLLKERRDN